MKRLGAADTPADSETETDRNMSEDSGNQTANQIPPSPPMSVRAGSTAGLKGGPSAVIVPRTRITLDLHQETAQALNELMDRTGDTPTTLFRKARSGSTS